MRTKYLLPLYFAICTQNTFAQVTFRKVFSDVPVDINVSGNDIKETSDSGYIVTGYNYQSWYGTFLIKLNSDGDTVWTKHYVANPTVGGASVFQTCDGGYASIYNGIIKTNSTGDTLWSKSYSDIFVSSGSLTSDCGYIIGGFTQSFGAGGEDIYIIKTDSSGNPLWSKTYGGDSTDAAYAIHQTSDGGYIIAGTSNGYSLGRRIYVIKTDAVGDTLWTRIYGSPDMIISSIQQTFDNGYIITGANNSSTYLIKTDSAGNVLWSKTYGPSVFMGYAVQQTSDSGYIFTCGMGYPIKVLYIKTDANGNVLWGHGWGAGTNADCYGTSILQATDGGYAIAGTVMGHQLVNNYSYINVTKTDDNGLLCGGGELTPVITASIASIPVSFTATAITSTTATVTASVVLAVSNMIIDASSCSSAGISAARPENPIKVYPNLVPKNGSVSISLDENLKDAAITVFNMMGVAVYSEVVSGKGKTVLLALKEKLSSGMYFVRIMHGNNMFVEKIVVL